MENSSRAIRTWRQQVRSSLHTPQRPVMTEPQDDKRAVNRKPPSRAHCLVLDHFAATRCRVLRSPRQRCGGGWWAP